MRCPVCQAVVKPIKHIITSKQTVGFRCSGGHVFHLIPSQEVRRAKELCGKVKAVRTAVHEEIKRARRLRSERSKK